MTAPYYEHMTDEELFMEGLSHQMDEYTLELWHRLARDLGHLEQAAAQTEEHSA